MLNFWLGLAKFKIPSYFWLSLLFLIIPLYTVPTDVYYPALLPTCPQTRFATFRFLPHLIRLFAEPSRQCSTFYFSFLFSVSFVVCRARRWML